VLEFIPFPVGQISYTEFLAASLGDDLQNDSKVLRKLFDSLDVTKDGKISAWDLEQLLGSDLGKYNVDSLLREGDTTGDMEIYFDEYVLSLPLTFLSYDYSSYIYEWQMFLWMEIAYLCYINLILNQ